MNVKLIAAVAAGVLAAPAIASAVTVDFEGVTTDASIGTLYQGLGVTFGPDALGFANDANFTFYSNAPSPLGVMGAVGPDAAMNAATNYSFANGVTFYYSSAFATTVKAYDGLNGTGNLLGSVDLAANTGGCTDPAFCQWDLATLSFSGFARSVTFGNLWDANLGGGGIDNVTVSAVPLPAAAWLLVSGLGSIGALLRRRRTR